MGTVTQILVAPAANSPMVSCENARALPGQGLEGDRYAIGHGTFSPHPPRPDFELTLIEGESIAGFVRETGIPFTAADARRNIVTAGVALNDLVGCDFKIGDIRVRGHRLCEPCNTLAKRTRPEVLRGFVHRGGLRAQILNAGVIRVGDTIVPEIRATTLHELRHDGYLISDDPARLDIDAMHRALLATHWGKDIPRDIFERSVTNSLCIGVYTSAREQIGLMRIISDYATFAYYCDVYILEPHRRKGLAQASMRAAETHPKLQLLRRQHLVTPDMQTLYARFGFVPVEQPGWHMEKRDPDVYQRLAKLRKTV